MTSGLAIGLAVGVIAALIGVVVLPYFGGKFSAAALSARCRKSQSIVLTYDDGPGPVITPALLEILKNKGVKATFFLLGTRVRDNPSLVDRILADGHEIGCHSFAHRHPWKVNPFAAVEDIDRGYESLRKWLNPSGLFRPPHGKITLFTWLALVKRRARIVWWTHDSGDTWAESPPPLEDLVENVVNSGGGVVLLHDFDRKGGAESPRHQFVLKATERIIDRAGEAGLRVVRAGDLLGAENLEIARNAD